MKHYQEMGKDVLNRTVAFGMVAELGLLQIRPGSSTKQYQEL